jgi:CubicO group peptidase (beta-lactamase class C family)
LPLTVRQQLFPRVRTRELTAIVALCGLANAGCVYTRIVYYGVPSLSAIDDFDRRVVHRPSNPTPLATAPTESVFSLVPSERRRYHTFDGMLEANDTRAFVALRDDRIVYERYFDGITATTLLPDFSVSKTFAALLVGRAIADHLLGPVDTPLVRYVPDVASRPGYASITIDELLRMTSGIDFADQSVAGAVLYYTTDLPDETYSFDVSQTPGTHYRYGSVGTQILWDVLHRRLRGETVSGYFERTVWGPLGAEHDAVWSLDSASSGVEKFFGGFNATARDHARLGLLFLHGGILEGRRVVPETWVDESLAYDPVAGPVYTTDGWVHRGKYEWFRTVDGRAYFAKGYRGQYVFVVPDAHMVFVRFGEGYGDVDWCSLFLRLADETATRLAVSHS